MLTSVLKSYYNLWSKIINYFPFGELQILQNNLKYVLIIILIFNKTIIIIN